MIKNGLMNISLYSSTRFTKSGSVQTVSASDNS